MTDPDDVSDRAAGINHGSRLTQRTAGVDLQLTASRDLFNWRNRATVGASFDRSHDGFSQIQQYANLTPDRSTRVIDKPGV